MMSDPRWSEALARLPDYLGSHLRVSAAALALGLVISFPLALLVRNRPALRGTFLGLASIVQTVPGLALLALFYPLLLILSNWSLQWFGAGFSAFGFLPSVLALALYSMLPVLRNTVTGLQGIDPAILEASQGVGMTPRQSLTMVELPLALPIIMAGLRVATVSTVALATIGSIVSYGGLGNLLLRAVGNQFKAQIFAASLLCILLAVALDLVLVGAQRLLTPWTRHAR